MPAGRSPSLTIIYALFDPCEPGRIRYVGKTNNARKRLECHRTPSRNSRSPVAHWARKLKRDGISVSMSTLETAQDWESAEKKWIAHYRAQGDNLLNIEEGGLGSWSKDKKKPPKTTKADDFKSLMICVGYIARKHTLAGDLEDAERVRWSQAVISRKRGEITQQGSDALAAWDRELAQECRPWKFYTVQQKAAIREEIWHGYA